MPCPFFHVFFCALQRRGIGFRLSATKKEKGNKKLYIWFFLCYTTPSNAGLVYRYYSSFPSWLGGFDSRTPLQKSASFDRRLPIFTYSLFTKTGADFWGKELRNRCRHRKRPPCLGVEVFCCRELRKFFWCFPQVLAILSVYRCQYIFLK